MGHLFQSLAIICKTCDPISQTNTITDGGEQAGRTIVELHFPDAGIVCNVAEAQMQGVVMSAFYGAPRNVLNPQVLKMLGDQAPKQADPEVIEIPVKLYARIRALAEITRDRAAYATKLKQDLAASGLFQKND